VTAAVDFARLRARLGPPTIFVSPGVAFGWVAFVWIAGILISSTAAADRFAAFEAAAQVTFLLVTIGASLVIARRRQSFDIEESE